MAGQRDHVFLPLRRIAESPHGNAQKSIAFQDVESAVNGRSFPESPLPDTVDQFELRAMFLLLLSLFFPAYGLFDSLFPELPRVARV